MKLLKGFRNVFGTIIFLSTVLVTIYYLPFIVVLYSIILLVSVLIIIAIYTETHQDDYFYFYIVVWVFLIAYAGIGHNKISNYKHHSELKADYNVSDYDYTIDTGDDGKGYTIYLTKDHKVEHYFQMDNETFLKYKDNLEDLNVKIYSKDTIMNQVNENKVVITNKYENTEGNGGKNE
jgi:hypothetical protein